MLEMIDIYDKNRNKTGKIINRKDFDALNEGEYRLAVYCWIVSPSKKILVARRSICQDNGGKWEVTHGGVRQGETSTEAIKRELKEELGINANKDDLIFIKTILKGNVFRDIYLLNKDIPIEDISFDDNEVMDCKYITLEELKNLIESGDFIFTDFKYTIFYDKGTNELLNRN